MGKYPRGTTQAWMTNSMHSYCLEMMTGSAQVMYSPLVHTILTTVRTVCVCTECSYMLRQWFYEGEKVFFNVFWLESSTQAGLWVPEHLLRSVRNILGHVMLSITANVQAKTKDIHRMST